MELITTLPAYWPAILLVGYLLGAIPLGYILVKAKTGQDLRSIGSGSTGTTNVKRAIGGKAALVVLAFDILKAVVPVWVLKALYPSAYWLHIGVALAVIIGHSRSVFLGFTGGKSAASSLGSMLALSPLCGLFLGVVAFTLFRLTKTMSIASILTAVLSPITFYLAGQPLPYWLYVLMAALYVIVLHRANIARLLQGQDNPLT